VEGNSKNLVEKREALQRKLDKIDYGEARELSKPSRLTNKRSWEKSEVSMQIMVCLLPRC